ncbi:hypothetical protein CesoFtcFv8_011260 [Champsocephalus esox]|uniref:Uncharacterized protein n=2 Tax=Champsocephalus TaxID=52236 RepID=A0AAN8DKI7_CHAGU|nr:hypothetical protein CesoFtcFv8_011260 [Champsocephalus esox]KAK5923615.1 hypothetical protein CgunFtcFv8_000567 [Champsocephalus gunnari]
MSLLIVSRAASSLPPAQTLEFHEMASACESRSTHLVSRFTLPAAVPADRSGCIRRLSRWGWGYTSQEGFTVWYQRLSSLDAAFPISPSFSIPRRVRVS